MCTYKSLGLHMAKQRDGKWNVAGTLPNNKFVNYTGTGDKGVVVTDCLRTLAEDNSIFWSNLTHKWEPCYV